MNSGILRSISFCTLPRPLTCPAPSNPRHLFVPLLAVAWMAWPGQAPSEEPVATAHAIHLEAKHWLWIARIIRQAPNYRPPHLHPSDPPFEMYTAKSAIQLYEECGMTFSTPEAMIYSAPTSQMIAKLTAANHRRLLLLHQTVDAWRAGRFHEWHHEEVTVRKP